MRAPLALVVATLLVGTPSRAAIAQSTARDSVVSVLQRVLDAMRARDTTSLRQSFDSTARLTSVPDSASRPTRPSTVSAFLSDIAGTTPEQAFDERIFDPEVRIEGPVAQLWTYYTFRQGTKFSHCGIDAVTLMRGAGGWRIVNWIWTARQTGCTRTD